MNERKKHAQISTPLSRPPSLQSQTQLSPQRIGRQDEDRVSHVKCANPYVTGGHAFGCGQCMPCRVNRRRVWTHRIMLEASQYKDNAFCTLTYDDDHLPADGSLRPRDVTLFLKVLRRAIEPLKIRYYAVGEYGDVSERPHYHLAVFGLPTCSRGRTMVRRNGICCSYCQQVRQCWPHGNAYLGSLEHASAAYCAGYCTKKLTDADDERLAGRHPEYARMSNRPGIGAGIMDDVASALLNSALDDIEDVPAALRHGAKLWPLGRYLRRRLRTRIGRDPEAPKSVLEKMAEELLPLRSLAHSYAAPGFKQFAFKNEVIKSGEGKRGRVMSRYKLHKKRTYL